MRFYLSVALKNVFRQKKRSFTLGINYAVVTFILALLFAFSAGGLAEHHDEPRALLAGHITVSGSYTSSGRVFQGVRRYPEVAAAASETFGSGVTVIPRYVVRSAVYYNGISKRLEFTGIDTGVDSGIKGQLRFLEGSWDGFLSADNAVVLPKDVATYFGLTLEDEIVLANRTRFGAFNTGTLKVKGIYETDNYFIQSLVLSRFPFIQSLDLAEADTASSLYLYFDEPTRLAERRDTLSTLLARGDSRQPSLPMRTPRSTPSPPPRPATRWTPRAWTGSSSRCPRSTRPWASCAP